MSTQRPVVILQLPEELDAFGAQTFMQEFEPLLQPQRPCIIFDCSEVRYLDGVGVDMLRHCLDEARKRDGDLKLAALSAEAQVVLELMRDTRVFEAFASSDEAVRSFLSAPPKVLQKVPSYANFYRETRVLKKVS